jgi:hypothetical protein
VGGCHIWLDRDYWPAPPSEQYCNLIAHEWGHLLGHGHSTDPNDLMWPQWTNDVVPGCRVFRASLDSVEEPAPTAPAKINRLSKLRRAKRARRACAARKHRGRRAYRRWLRHHARRARQLGCTPYRSKSKKHRARGARVATSRRWHGHELQPGAFWLDSADDASSFSLPLSVGALR